LLPRSGNKKQEFGLWVAGATHVSSGVMAKLLRRTWDFNRVEFDTVKILD
jgi:hypothetical protein